MPRTEPTLSTHDLRKAAIDYKRDSDRKHKWALGEVPLYGQHEVQEGRRRPRKRHPGEPFGTNKEHNDMLATVEHCSQSARKYGVLPAHFDSGTSDDNTTDDARQTPEPDADITYSFDNSRGASTGSQVLGAAVAKAVERFRNRETDKLVKEEYEMLDQDGEPIIMGRKPLKNKGKGKTVAPEPLHDDYEADYEFL